MFTELSVGLVRTTLPMSPVLSRTVLRNLPLGEVTVDPISFLQDLTGVNRAAQRNEAQYKSPKMARIDWDYDPATWPMGAGPRVIFDGESTVSQQQYMCLSPYWPHPGDRVLMQPVGSTYVIIGTVGPEGSVYASGESQFDGIMRNSSFQTAALIVSQNTSSTSYTDLNTPGPSVTLRTGTRALCWISCNARNNSSGESLMAVEVSGATTISPSDNDGIDSHGTTEDQWGLLVPFSNLTPGLNTFTCKYRVTSGTGTFRRRKISVLTF